MQISVVTDGSVDMEARGVTARVVLLSPVSAGNCLARGKTTLLLGGPRIIVM